MARDETGTVSLESWAAKPEWLGRKTAGRILSQGQARVRVVGPNRGGGNSITPSSELRQVPRMRRSSLSQTLGFMNDPLALLAAAQRECGDIFLLRLLGMGDWVFLCSPELVQEFYQVPHTHLSAGVANREFMGRLLGEDALFCLEGPPHLDRRRLLFPLLNGPGALGHTEGIRSVVESSVETWPTDEPVALLPLLGELTLRAFFRGAFGDLESARLEKISALASDYFDRGLRSKLVMMPILRWNLGPKSPWGRVVAMRRGLQDALAAEIEHRRRHPSTEPQGLVDEMLAPGGRPAEGLSTRALVHELCTLAFGSNESTPKLLTWTVLGILSNPEVVPRIRRELDRVVGDDDLRGDHIERLDYLEAVIHEGMRFQPSTDTAGVRRALKPTRLGGYTVPKNAVVTQCLSAIARRPELFAQVGRFEPGHFLHTGLKAHHWKPFGGGHRTCAGKGFALMEMKVVLATLFRRFDVELGNAGSDPVREGFFRVPRGGGEVILRPRNEARSAADRRPGEPVRRSEEFGEDSAPSRGESPAESGESRGEQSAASRCPFFHRS